MSLHRHRRPRPRATALATVAALATTGGLLGAPAALGTADAGPAPATAAPPAADSARAADGARITAVRRIDDRTLDLTVNSPAVGRELPVRVLLPASFAAHPDRTWPVLQLLQGAHDDYTSWTRETDIEEFTADKDVLTVLPSSGPTGIPTDWWDFGGSGAPDYETFQVTEVMQLLRANYRANGRRAVAGVSTGGYGAMACAARHPGSFGAAASYSGVLDTTDLGMPAVIGAIVAREGKLPAELWGGRLLHADNWRRHNPAALAAGLKGTRLYLSQGSGLPGGDFGDLEGAVLEGTLWGQAHSFSRRLAAAGVPARTHFYQGGSHAWPNWQAEFKASWPTLAAGLGLPA